MNTMILSAVVALGGLVALGTTACKIEQTGGGRAGAGGSYHGGNGGSYYYGGSGGSYYGGSGGTYYGGSGGSYYGGSGGSGSCSDCACYYQSGDVPAGCADTCDNTISGAASPNFCNGAGALPQCAQCIMDRCGAAPENCY